MKPVEYIDVYDRDRRATGLIVPRETSLAPGEYRLVVHICVFNSAGKMLIQLRSKDKAAYGGLWDISAGGHSRAGENSAAAAERELFEELGISMDFSRTDPAMCLNFPGGFDDYYVIDRDGDIDSLKLQREEVDTVRWADAGEICAMIDSGEFLPFHKSFFDFIFEMHKNGLDFFRK